MSDTLLDDLPDEVRELIAPHMVADDTSMLAAIGVEIGKKRDEAKAARASSGIETVWQAADEAYIGIDDANRHEFTDGKWQKPMSSDGPVTTSRDQKNTSRQSTVYLRLTSRYVDAGAAKLTEILLPADDKAFSFSEMPVPELIAASEDESQVVHSDTGVPLTRALKPGEVHPWPIITTPSTPVPPMPAAGPPAPGAPPQAPPLTPAPEQRVALTVKDLAVEKIEMARKKAKAAETRIDDWMTQTQYRAEIRKVICDAARLGVGVLKAPTPVSKRVMAITQNKDGGVDLTIKQKIVPAARWVNPWDAYPDPACGENIQDGDFFFERDHMSARQVRGLKNLPGYIAAQIDKVLEEGPNKVNASGNERGGGPDTKNKDRFEVWFFTGTLTKDEMQAIDRAANKERPFDGSDMAHVIVTLINDSVVRATINPLDSGELPYHSMPWQRRAKHWGGIGVAEQMRTPQRITNASLRALLNNAGISAGVQLVINQRALRPSDGDWAVTPNKVWLTTDDGSDDVRKDFLAIEIPNVTQQLTEIIQLGERFAEETTSIPLITQGQSGATTPDTFGAAQLQNNNANQLLRSIGYAFDDFITEPVVRQYYEWLLLDPDVPNEEKGEFQIDAHGSIALVERAIQDQTIAQMGNMAANPIYGTDPKKWAKMFYKSKHLNPDDLMYSKEDQDKMDAAPPPEQPAVTVAKINQDTQLKLGVMKQTTDQQTTQAEGVIEEAANTLEGNRIHVDATVRLHELEMQHQQALMEYANRNQISLADAKTQLAKTAMQLQTERDLNNANNQLDLHKHRNPQPPKPRPPIQVPGRAGNGRAFSQAPAQ